MIVHAGEIARYLDFICTPKFPQTGVTFSFSSNCMYIVVMHKVELKESGEDKVLLLLEGGKKSASFVPQFIPLINKTNTCCKVLWSYCIT